MLKTLQNVLLISEVSMPRNPEKIKKEGYLEEKFHYFHLKDTAGQERDFHFHEFDKIVILLSGQVDYAVENDVYSLKPWDVLLVRHHCIHKAIIDKSKPYERIIIYLNEAYFSSVLPDADITACFSLADIEGRRLLSPAPKEKKEIRGLLNSVERYSSLPSMREALMIQFLIMLGQLSSAGESEAGYKSNEKIDATLSYINENFSKELSVDELASRVYLSRYHFMRLFRQATGSSVHSYVRQKRLLNASRLIREGMAAQDAAALSGYDDYSAFYRAFRESFGIAPGKLKK